MRITTTNPKRDTHRMLVESKGWTICGKRARVFGYELEFPEVAMIEEPGFSFECSWACLEHRWENHNLELCPNWTLSNSR